MHFPPIVLFCTAKLFVLQLFFISMSISNSNLDPYPLVIFGPLLNYLTRIFVTTVKTDGSEDLCCRPFSLALETTKISFIQGSLTFSYYRNFPKIHQSGPVININCFERQQLSYYKYGYVTELLWSTRQYIPVREVKLPNLSLEKHNWLV